VIAVLLLLLGCTMVIPFFWSVVQSLTPKLEQESGTFSIWTSHPTIENWKALGRDNWWLYFFNTLIVAFGEIAGSLIFSTMAAYAFAKFEFPGKKILYRVMLFSMMIPGIITLLPQYIVVTKIPWYTFSDVGPGLVNSFFGIILPQAVSIYGILFLRQFFVEQSDEIGEAARVDGANEFQIYLIYFRMALPGITTLGLFTFISTWNSYLWPSMILYTSKKYTLGIALTEFQTTATNTGEIMAAALFSIIPIVGLFIFTQKYFMKDTTYTGIK
jgi:multiple sugar transport system permease protein